MCLPGLQPTRSFLTCDAQTFSDLTYVKGSLPIYYSGRTTGITVDFGEDVTAITPVYEGIQNTYYCVFTNLTRLSGSPISWAAQALRVGAKDVSYTLMSLLNASGHSFTTSAEFSVVRGMIIVSIVFSNSRWWQISWKR